MASKYLSAGTASWTASTRTISGATMNPVFEETDASMRRQIIFRIGSGIYFGRISSLVSGSSIVLINAGSLPAVDGTIAEIILLDLNESHSYQRYVDKIKAMIKDQASALTGDDIDLAIAQAVSEYSNDKPFTIKMRIAGNGTSDYRLSTIFGSAWISGYSRITSIEYPAGEMPPRLLEDDEWLIYDDGQAQDGSNHNLRFLYNSPVNTEFFIVAFLTEMSLPAAGVQNFPDTEEHFTNITLLAAEHCCLLLAAHYTQSSDSTINADVVNYNDKSRKYTRLAWLYKRRYNRNVFGREEIENSHAAAMIDKDVDLSASSGNTFLFHGGAGR